MYDLDMELWRWHCPIHEFGVSTEFKCTNEWHEDTRMTHSVQNDVQFICDCISSPSWLRCCSEDRPEITH